MKYIVLSQEEKAAFFDKIASLFFQQNFGQASKSEIELLMFHFYLDKMIQTNKRRDGTIDYKLCSDYKISQELGITPQRVQNLKLKSHLVYPIEFDWQKSFATLISNADYDAKKQMVIINIPDPTLMIKIQEFIEDNGGYIERRLNNKVLQMKTCYFIQLLIAVEPQETKANLIDAIKKSMRIKEKENCAFDENHIGKNLLSMAIDISQLLLNIKEVATPKTTVGNAILSFLYKIYNHQ